MHISIIYGISNTEITVRQNKTEILYKIQECSCSMYDEKKKMEFRYLYKFKFFIHIYCTHTVKKEIHMWSLVHVKSHRVPIYRYLQDHDSLYT